MKPNCLSYCSDSGKCNNIRRFCPFKDDTNLSCSSGGVIPEDEKKHDYNSNRVGGYSFTENASKKGKL